jgi:hypothetical protein
MSSKKEEKVNPRCLEYAQQHTIMLLLLLLFFGVLIVPRFYEQVLQSQYNKNEGVVKTIYFSQYTPVVSFVEIVYNVDEKEYSVKELLNQHVQVGDHLEIYVGKDKKSIQFQKPSMAVPASLLVVYFIILVLCLYKIYCFFSNKK